MEENRLVHDPTKADVILINTCGFIDSAKEESISAILEAVRIKEERDKQKPEIVVMGCLSQRYGKALKKHIPEIDRLYGVHQVGAVAGALGCPVRPIQRRRLLNPSHYAYLKISDGCNHRCGFCAIPMIRGALHSAKPEQLVQEAQYLASLGVKELIFVSQDTTAYGFDWPHTDKKNNAPLIQLLERLHEIRGIEWIRLMYFYPSLISRALLRAMATMPKVCKYLDVPIQHISDRVLKAMRRGTTGKQIYATLSLIREEMPQAAIRTSLIVGHPLEGRREFRELCDLVENFRFERLGVFTYSPEEGTFSATLRPQCSPATRQKRYNEIMERQQAISLKQQRQHIGTTLKVIVDRKEANAYYGRTQWDAPEIDGEVIITPKKSISPGALADIYITDADIYDLYGHPATRKE